MRVLVVEKISMTIFLTSWMHAFIYRYRNEIFLYKNLYTTITVILINVLLNTCNYKNISWNSKHNGEPVLKKVQETILNWVWSSTDYISLKFTDKPYILILLQMHYLYNTD